MNTIYKWARVVSAIFVGMLMLICTAPFIIIALNGVDESSIPMLITSLFFLVFLVFSALSFRFMHKNETEKKKRIGLFMLVIMLIAMFIYSLYAEKKRIEQETKEQELQSIQKKINEENAISNVIKGLIIKIEENKITPVSETTK